ncbi:MAG: hypothetical protein ACXAEX_14240 [Promethearchaeota archaeon]|jgi:hypothetical protein
MNEILSYMTQAILYIVSSSETPPTGNPLPLGYIVIGVIATPVVVLLLASLLGRPRSNKITALFLGWLAMMFTAFIGAVFVLSYLLGIFY